ncbi:hypothetical protein C4D60_Mb10t01540 [Musa balbisiana]|uniref:Uncharacterized protein n=1 Tax=Musa balbisiana TaxID=52838 RepID=A0A4S8IU12_MUSBA|nr:hypothetical protein C4D60_Mb10t01540 [Musa balbisiana]
MVAAEAMLDAGLEIPRVATAVGASLQADPVTLCAGSLADVAVPAIEHIHPEPVPQALVVLPPVPASPRPGLDPVAIVLSVDTVALVPPLRREEAVHAAAGAPATVELPLVGAAVAIDLHSIADGHPVVLLLLFGLVAATAVFVADEPVDRRSAAGGERGNRDEGGAKEEVGEEREVTHEVKEEETGEDEGEEEEVVMVVVQAATGAVGLLLLVVGLGDGGDALDGVSIGGGSQERRLRAGELTLLHVYLDQPLVASHGEERRDFERGNACG